MVPSTSASIPPYPSRYRNRFSQQISTTCVGLILVAGYPHLQKVSLSYYSYFRNIFSYKLLPVTGSDRWFHQIRPISPYGPSIMSKQISPPDFSSACRSPVGSRISTIAKSDIHVFITTSETSSAITTAGNRVSFQWLRPIYHHSQANALKDSHSSRIQQRMQVSHWQ